MRELKFRAWNSEKEMMQSVESIHPYQDDSTKGGEVFLENEPTPSYYFPEQVVLMQFTGLHDKNRKEIYEGDVIRIHNFKTEWKHGEPSIDWRLFEVRWNRYLHFTPPCGL